jgi:hypothetical protein
VPSHGPLFDDAARRREAELLELVESTSDGTSLDAATVAVYADWLEEQGDIPRATFLRTQQQLAATNVSSPKLLERGRALFDLGKTLDPEWIAAVTYPKIAGSAWDGRDDDGALIWRFLPTGFVNYTQPSGTFENGRWEQIGITVALETNAHYADYFGVIIGHTMRGNAHNIVGHKWRWKVVRTGDPTLVSVPDSTNRTIHDDHVRQPPIHRTPKRAGADGDAAKKKKPKTPMTKTRLATRKPLARTSSMKPGRMSNAKPGRVSNAKPGRVSNAKPGRVSNAKPGRTSNAPRQTPLGRKKPLGRRTPVRSNR